MLISLKRQMQALGSGQHPVQHGAHDKGMAWDAHNARCLAGIPAHVRGAA